MNKQKLKFLRSLAHERKPYIWIGQHGLTNAVIDELHKALDQHELLKIKLRVGDRAERDKVCNDICDRCDAILIQKIGNTATVFRANKDTPVIQF